MAPLGPGAGSAILLQPQQPERAPQGGGERRRSEAQPYQFKVFRALLAQLEVDDYEAVQLTDAIRDWTDKDTQLVSSNGAEDAYYEGLNPPTWWLTSGCWAPTNCGQCAG